MPTPSRGDLPLAGRGVTPGPGTGAGHTIDILLATYNGERFIDAQIESVLRQNRTDWMLTVRDDCSTDGTLALVHDLARRHPGRITVQARPTASGSAKQNFLEMLTGSHAPYVMLCDHDDVWLEDKIALTAARMRELEHRFGADVPLLVHSDLIVTDAELQVLSPSMMDAQQLDGRESRLGRLIIQNVVTGCTVMVNRPLADMVREPFDEIVMHDWWLALIASAFGAIGFLERPTVLYRQHGTNTVGARPSRSLSYKMKRLLDKEGVTRSLADSYAQAEAFLGHFDAQLSQEQASMIRAYAAIPHLGKVGRLQTLRRNGFWKNTAVRRLGQVLYV